MSVCVCAYACLLVYVRACVCACSLTKLPVLGVWWRGRRKDLEKVDWGGVEEELYGRKGGRGHPLSFKRRDQGGGL